MERKVILYIAVSLDGFIADPNGGVGWLSGEDESYTGDFGYGEFIDTIDTVVLGMTTYRQIATELSPGNWPYSGMQSYVLTHQPQQDTHEIAFVNEDVCTLVERLKTQSGKHIWICGGTGIVTPLIKTNLIDEYHITIIPVLLGGGVGLFVEEHVPIPLKLLGTHAENGMVQILYGRR